MIRSELDYSAANWEVDRLEELIATALQDSQRPQALCELALAAADGRSYQRAAELAVSIQDDSLRERTVAAVVAKLPDVPDEGEDRWVEERHLEHFADVRAAKEKLGVVGLPGVKPQHPWEQRSLSSDEAKKAMEEAARRGSAAARADAYAEVAWESDDFAITEAATAAGEAEAAQIVGAAGAARAGAGAAAVGGIAWAQRTVLWS